MIDKLIVIICSNNHDENKWLEEFLYDNGYHYLTDSQSGRNLVNYAIILEGNIIRITEKSLKILNKIPKNNIEIIIYNSPTEYIRSFKLYKIKNRIKK